jgi:two-component system alkaline phosphatase synthesis response regulator PhoP
MSELEKRGFRCSTAIMSSDISSQLTEYAPDLLLIKAESPHVLKILHTSGQKEDLPVMALARPEIVESLNGQIDDFVCEPYNIAELTVRINRLLKTNDKAIPGEIIKCGDLKIDLSTCEVLVADRPVMLTFREYELLKFLASNAGRVFSRNSLLNRVWGYDYYGGDRTVDVHIRRLRGKIEDSTHTFIETVRNIGYRFKKAVN